MMYGFVSLLSTYYAAGGRGGGTGEGRGGEVAGFGDTLSIFISSCLFGCAPGFFFCLFVCFSWLEIAVKM